MTNHDIDAPLIILTLLLIAFGLVMVASSSMVISDAEYGYPFHYLMKQSIFLSFGFVGAYIMFRIPQEYLSKYSLIILGAGFLLLCIVLIPGIGRVVNGSRRWLNFGFIGFQVSEIVKLCAFVYIASYVTRFQDEVRNTWQGFFKPLILLFVMALLLLKEPDFGAVVVMSSVFLGVLFLSGTQIRPFLLVLIVGACLLGLLIIMAPYRMARLTNFMNPWHNAFGSGYQLTQSLIAFGRGGWCGVGLGNSIQKLFYLPEAHTDFIFAVIAEELGLIGEVALLLLFSGLVWRIFSIGRRAMEHKHPFSGYFCYATALWFAFQVIVNIGVCAGLLPTKGLTLPFISYGGSSILVNCLVIGIILRAAYESS